VWTEVPVSPFSIHVPSIRVPNAVTAGEFVELHDGTVGRVLSIDINAKCPQKSLFELQLFRPIAGLTDENLISTRDDEESIAASGIAELVRTNISICVKPESVDRLVFPLHYTALKTYKFGAVAGRSNMYVWRFDVFYSDAKDAQPSNRNKFMLPEKFRDFGPGKDGELAETLSERIMYALRDQVSMSTKLLHGAGKPSGRNLVASTPKLLEQHQYEAREFERFKHLAQFAGKSVGIEETTRKRKRVVHVGRVDIMAQTHPYTTDVTLHKTKHVEGSIDVKT